MFSACDATILPGMPRPAATTRSSAPACGGLAQLGERYNGIVEVRGSSPLSSTNLGSHGIGLALLGAMGDREDSQACGRKAS